LFSPQEECCIQGILSLMNPSSIKALERFFWWQFLLLNYFVILFILTMPPILLIVGIHV